MKWSNIIAAQDEKTCTRCSELFIPEGRKRVCLSCCIRSCEQCQTEFVVDLKTQRKKRFCSKSCASRFNALNSPVIRKNFEEGKKSPARALAVSKALTGKPRYDLRGENNPQWKDGVNRSATQDIRRGWQYREWRTAVYERDDYTCQRCGIRGSDLHAHHIAPYAEVPELRFEVGNGETLCVPCHKEHHYAMV